MPGDTSSVKISYRGVDIITYNQANMYPGNWYEDPVSAYSLPLDINNESRALSIVKAALDKYPQELLNSNLKKVYLLSALEFYGLPYGGTYYDNKVYLCIKDASSGYDSKYIEKSFHHEFSSILLKNYSIDELKWKSANQSGFSYGEGGKEALNSGSTGLNFDAKYNKMGFLNQYSTASFEEDFNEICGNLFLSSTQFWDITANYPGVMKKVQMAIDFYSGINPVLTEEYFRGLEQ